MRDVIKQFPKYKLELTADAAYTSREELEKDLDFYLQIPCKFGVISQYNKECLKVYSTSMKLRKKLESIPFETKSIGDEELVFRIKKQYFKQVARVLKPKLNDKELEKVKAKLEKARAARHE